MIQLRVKLFTILTLFYSVSFALPSDQNQVVHVQAESADLSQQNHKGIYKGNVTFQQGTTNILASDAITKGSEKNELVLAIANGDGKNQAHYWTKTSETEPPFHAYADSIRYYPAKHMIELRGNARVEQGKNSMSADVIQYDTLKQHVLTQSHVGGRTKIVFYPEKKTS